MQKFQTLVDRWYRDRKDIGEYAGQLGITTTQLNRICRDILGKSALGVINGRITLEAERDLIYTSIDVKNIALSLGFSDAAYFSRFFVKQTGHTPTEFRSAARERLARENPRARKPSRTPEK